MNSRAKIGTLAKTDPALLVPYGGEQRAIGELQALGVTLTPEDYRVIRQALGGGKRGRARARELVPLKCPSCESRLTHYERNGREPYFAAANEGSAHGPHCDVIQAAPADAVAEVIQASLASEASAREQSPPASGGTAGFDGAERTATAPVSTDATEEVIALSDDDLELGWSPPERVDTPQSSPPAPVPAGGSSETTFYFISGAPEPSAGALRLARLGLGSPPPSEAEPQTVPRGIQLGDARQLLIQALNRALPTPCVVRYRGHDHAVVAAADLHERVEGERVAVYGRLTESEWNAQAGRLTLKATQRTVQVWATAAAPRQLLQVESTDRLEAPVLSKPMPFLAFGTLRRLGPTCGIPVIRGDSLVLLQPLTAGLREPSAEQVAAQDGLTVESLDELGEPRDSEPAVPRDSELYELFDGEPDQVVHDATSWNLDTTARAQTASVEASLAHEVDPGKRADGARASAAHPTVGDARADGLELSPAGTSLAAPDLAAPTRGRGALSSLRSLASSLRRSKSRGGPA